MIVLEAQEVKFTDGVNLQQGGVDCHVKTSKALGTYYVCTGITDPNQVRQLGFLLKTPDTCVARLTQNGLAQEIALLYACAPVDPPKKPTIVIPAAAVTAPATDAADASNSGELQDPVLEYLREQWRRDPLSCIAAVGLLLVASGCAVGVVGAAIKDDVLRGETLALEDARRKQAEREYQEEEAVKAANKAERNRVDKRQYWRDNLHFAVHQMRDVIAARAAGYATPMTGITYGQALSSLEEVVNGFNKNRNPGEAPLDMRQLVDPLGDQLPGGSRGAGAQQEQRPIINLTVLFHGNNETRKDKGTVVEGKKPTRIT